MVIWQIWKAELLAKMPCLATEPYSPVRFIAVSVRYSITSPVRRDFRKVSARENGFDAISVINASPDLPGYMKGKLLVSKLVADRSTGRILGAQCAGPAM